MVRRVWAWVPNTRIRAGVLTSGRCGVRMVKYRHANAFWIEAKGGGLKYGGAKA
jgi:hypothetical protein